MLEELKNRCLQIFMPEKKGGEFRPECYPRSLPQLSEMRDGVLCSRDGWCIVHNNISADRQKGIKVGQSVQRRFKPE